MRLVLLGLACLTLRTGAMAQSANPSTFATVEVRLDGRYVGGWTGSFNSVEGPARIAISYGQPHLRGRDMMGKLEAAGGVWRLGANLATTLRTDVDINIGGTKIPHGIYSLFAHPTADGWQLIVNREIGQWGEYYDPANDVAHIPLQKRTLKDSVESLSMYLIPSAGSGTAHGTFKIVWEKTELSADWKVEGESPRGFLRAH